MKRVILAGGSGFLGQVLTRYFTNAGYEVVILTRSPGASSDNVRHVTWDACTIGAWTRELEGAAAIINLTGRSVNCRYTMHNRREVMESRVNSTRVIGETILKCKRPLPVWLNSSTATIYKHTLGPAWDESGEIAATTEAKDAFFHRSGASMGTRVQRSAYARHAQGCHARRNGFGRGEK